MLFLQNFYIGFLQPFWLTMSHTWTIAVENQFYVLAGAALLSVPARMHAALVAMLLAMAAGLTVGLALSGMSSHALRLMPCFGMVHLCAGGLLSLGLSQGWLSRRMLSAPSAAAALLALLFVAHAPAAGPWLDWGTMGFAGNVASVTALVALVGHVVTRQDGALCRALEAGPLRGIGTVSYGLYLVHVPIALAIAKPFGEAMLAAGLPGGLYPVVFFAVLMALSLAASAVLWVAVERPFLALRAGRVRPARAAPALAAA